MACDVSNNLYGDKGATYIFGPQKGADDEMPELLDEGFKCYAELTLQEMNIDISKVEGGGAAGGLNDQGINAVFSIQSSPISMEEAMQSERTQFNAEKTAKQVMRVLKINI